jgi:hypothetical protein
MLQTAKIELVPGNGRCDIHISAIRFTWLNLKLKRTHVTWHSRSVSILCNWITNLKKGQRRQQGRKKALHLSRLLSKTCEMRNVISTQPAVALISKARKTPHVKSNKLVSCNIWSLKEVECWREKQILLLRGRSMTMTISNILLPRPRIIVAWHLRLCTPPSHDVWTQGLPDITAKLRFWGLSITSHADKDG